MVVRTRLTALILAVAALTLPLSGAWASGPSETEPWYIDQYGGDAPDLNAWFDGRLGIVMPTAPRPMRFVDWRLLHGRKVGRTAGEALATPCCSEPYWVNHEDSGKEGWRKVRSAISGLPDIGFLQTDRAGPDNTSIPNCFDDAFDKAAATLTDRARRYGARSDAVKAWIAAQDAVFQACARGGVDLPPPMPSAPAWLAKDRAYQQAALALYDGRWEEAAVDFEAIGHDPASPWRDAAPYLAARALSREALALKTSEAYAKARSAIGVLAATNAANRDQAQGMIDVLEYNQRPAALLIQRTAELDAAAADPRLAVQFRDFTDLAEAARARPEALDWIDTIRAAPPPFKYDTARETPAQAAARFEAARRNALHHAVERWRAGRDVAWLVAAIGLVDPGDPEAVELIAAADQVPASSPAFVDLQHHRIRLTLSRASAAETRRRIDGVRASRPLSVSDRNVFTAQRLQVAADLKDFVHFALRRRLCTGADQDYEERPPRCVRQRWLGDVQPDGVYDGARGMGTTGLGDDARALIDRAPLAQRIALSRDPALPARLRLDIALTSYARAVQLQDNAAIDGLSHQLAPLLPLMAAEFHAIPAARPGPAKRFAEFLVLAKIPGVRVDLVDYTRPEGRRVVDFQQYWTDWAILKRPVPGLAPPALVLYQALGAGYDGYYPAAAWPDGMTDLACLGECGRGSAPLRTPDFLAKDAAKAAAERAFFFKADHDYEKPGPDLPPGAVDTWDEMLAYISAHPNDPRAPEALYWLVHVAHFGGSHNRSGRRAFLLLHHRYEGTTWAKKTRYYND